MKNILLTFLTLLAFTFNLYAENMEMIDTNGKSYKVVGTDNELRIEGMEGKVIFLEFFGLSCPACKKALPHLINLQEKYKDKFQVMAIEVQKNDVKSINDYKQKYGVNFITFSNYDVGRVARYVMEKSGWQGAIPFVVAIDSKGQVQFAQAGMMPEEVLAKYIEQFSK